MKIDREKIEKFYESETGLNAKKATHRIDKIIQFLEHNKIGIDDCWIQITSDFRWCDRRNRTEKERNAWQIGQTNRMGYVTKIVFL